ncbi:multiple epidermal growth factor-like domains protein 10 [Mya arenaria]|uniref:multiple epidermal growth factor-like domains protein 10 n=2 Tax=Mya arenaria TaxID=6604 RepID=UPI0022E0EECC|nr:multiple epidermal growth factor-like domains protein 10 [Mya arenaria]
MEIKVFLKIVVFVSFGFYLCGGTQCDSNCTECDGSASSGACLKCEDGFYPNQFNCQPCTYPNCKTCSNPSTCDSCKDGFWGETCIATCAEGCVNETCNTSNGFCSCLTNFYGKKCDGQCSDHCVPSTCFGISGNCLCKQGYFGASCRSQCGNYCADCTNFPSCSLCETGKFGDTCQSFCQCDGNAECDIVTGECLPCGTDCLSCNNNVCTACGTGKYGSQCEHTCSSTCYDVCDNQGNCQSCVSGYYGHHCEFECNCEFGCDHLQGHCLNEACPINCNDTCDVSSHTCYSCSRGYHGPYCNFTCPGKCADSRCYSNGSCLSCETGYYGNSCNMECQQMCESNKCRQNDGLCEVCPANCVSCESNTACTRCKESKYGQICSLSCNDKCTDKMCNIKGECYNCSSVSAFGNYCNLTCNHECYLSSCDRYTGACKSCKNNSVFGIFCSETCSPYCLGNKCERESGVCLNGCSDGYFGAKCDQECSKGCRNSSGTICDLEGTCLGGCTKGYLGQRCFSDGRNQQTEETNSGSVIGRAVGGVLGVCVVVALVVVVLVLKKKGIIWKESKKTYEDISPGRSQDEPYTTLAAASTTEYEIPDSEPRSELTIEVKGSSGERESGWGTDTLKKATDQANKIVSIHADASFNGVVGGMDSDEPDGLSFIPNLTDEEDAESESLRSSKLPPPSKIMMAAQPTAGPSKSSYQEHKQERVVKRRKTKAEELIDWQIIYFQNQVELAQQEKEINRVKLRVMEKYEKKLDTEEIDNLLRELNMNM